MYPWSNAPAAPAYAVGDQVRSGDNPEPGTVVSVDAVAGTIRVLWRDVSLEHDCAPETLAITYPIDAPYLRKKLPWE